MQGMVSKYSLRWVLWPLTTSLVFGKIRTELYGLVYMSIIFDKLLIQIDKDIY